MTRLALLLLVLTSLAPIGIVQGAVQLGEKHWEGCAWFTGGAIVLLLLCVTLLFGVAQAVPLERRSASEFSPKESEPLAFLVAYALPLVASSTRGSTTGMIAFSALMGLAIWQQQVFHVNPLLAVLGYHFFAAKNDSGAPILIMTRERTPQEGVLSVVRLSEYLWLQCRSASPGRRDDAGAHDPERQEPPSAQPG